MRNYLRFQNQSSRRVVVGVKSGSGLEAFHAAEVAPGDEAPSPFQPPSQDADCTLVFYDADSGRLLAQSLFVTVANGSRVVRLLPGYGVEILPVAQRAG